MSLRLVFRLLVAAAAALGIGGGGGGLDCVTNSPSHPTRPLIIHLRANLAATAASLPGRSCLIHSQNVDELRTKIECMRDQEIERRRDFVGRYGKYLPTDWYVAFTARGRFM